MPPRRGAALNPNPKPSNRAFAEGEAKEHRLLVEKKRGQDGSGFYFLLNGAQRFEDGYLLKQVAVKSLLLEEALPPLDELQRFNQARLVLDLGAPQRARWRDAPAMHTMRRCLANVAVRLRRRDRSALG